MRNYRRSKSVRWNIVESANLNSKNLIKVNRGEDPRLVGVERIPGSKISVRKGTQSEINYRAAIGKRSFSSKNGKTAQEEIVMTAGTRKANPKIKVCSIASWMNLLEFWGKKKELKKLIKKKRTINFYPMNGNSENILRFFLIHISSVSFFIFELKKLSEKCWQFLNFLMLSFAFTNLWWTRMNIKRNQINSKTFQFHF